MAYCTAAEVDEILGGSLEAEALAAAAGVVEGVSDVIDLYTGQSWVAGTVTGEVQTVSGGRVTLDRPPVAAVSLVTVTDPYIGAVPVVLVAGTGYQLINPQTGLLLVSAADGAIASVSYTSSPAAVPDHINLAAKILAAHCIRYAIDPTGWTLSQLEAGSARLTYTGGGAGGDGSTGGTSGAAGLPPFVVALLAGSRPPFMFA